MTDVQLIDVNIKRHKWGSIGHTLRQEESSVARQAMQWNPLNGIARRKGDPARRGDELWKGSARIETKTGLI